MLSRKIVLGVLVALAMVAVSRQGTFAATACQADINQDGIVSLIDYSLLVQDFNPGVVQTSSSDITQDSLVDLQDYSALVSNFFQTCNVSSPQPSPYPSMSPSPVPSPVPSVLPSPSPIPVTTPSIGGCTVFPSDNPWNQNISSLPVHPQSAQYVQSIGSSAALHPDFGGASYGEEYGIPFITVTNQQAMLPITFTAYGDESDPGPYPIPTSAPIEGGSNSTGDRHVLALNTDTCTLYELYRAFPATNGWNADSGAVFNLSSNQVRPKGWTSADAAGLPILPGLVRYSEVAAGSVNHAVRFTAPSTQRGFIFPARHFASSSTNQSLPPMGARFRLKASTDISNLTGQALVIAQAMKKYGIILADNGGAWFFQGDVSDAWNDNQLNQLKSLKGSDFEAVYTGDIEQ